ncbi:MAG: hypothetical protein NW220_19850 [Leptolyngbyaceae cyanobacterium bins.349]|nr:hypothetical protein [Leptolyngbyaceae cyanobacterium bins.349]
MKFLSPQHLAIAGLISSLAVIPTETGIALPSPDLALPAADIPEEILRTHIILDARSPIDGRPMTPAEYAALEAQEQTSFQPPEQLSPQVRGVVNALRIRRFIKRVLPFIPIK